MTFIGQRPAGRRLSYLPGTGQEGHLPERLYMLFKSKLIYAPHKILINGFY